MRRRIGQRHLARRGKLEIAVQGDFRWAEPRWIDVSDRHVRRELREETGVSAAFLEQLGAFGHPDRDPRERVITVAYYALVDAAKLVRDGSKAFQAGDVATALAKLAAALQRT